MKWQYAVLAPLWYSYVVLSSLPTLGQPVLLSSDEAVNQASIEKTESAVDQIIHKRCCHKRCCHKRDLDFHPDVCRVSGNEDWECHIFPRDGTADNLSSVQQLSSTKISDAVSDLAGYRDNSSENRPNNSSLFRAEGPERNVPCDSSVSAVTISNGNSADLVGRKRIKIVEKQNVPLSDASHEKIAENRSPSPPTTHSGHAVSQSSSMVYQFLIGTQARKMNRFDFASFDAGSKIVDFSPLSVNVKSVQKSDADSYMLTPCNKPAWFTISFPEDIFIEQIVFHTNEFYSSVFSKVAILASDSFPAAKWRLLGLIKLSPFVSSEVFDLETVCKQLKAPSCWTKHLKVQFLSYYPVEESALCTLTRFQIFGRTVIQSLDTKMKNEVRQKEQHQSSTPRAESADEHRTIIRHQNLPNPRSVEQPMIVKQAAYPSAADSGPRRAYHNSMPSSAKRDDSASAIKLREVRQLAAKANINLSSPCRHLFWDSSGYSVNPHYIPVQVVNELQDVVSAIQSIESHRRASVHDVNTTSNLGVGEGPPLLALADRVAAVEEVLAKEVNDTSVLLKSTKDLTFSVSSWIDQTSYNTQQTITMRNRDALNNANRVIVMNGLVSGFGDRELNLMAAQVCVSLLGSWQSLLARRSEVRRLCMIQYLQRTSISECLIVEASTFSFKSVFPIWFQEAFFHHATHSRQCSPSDALRIYRPIVLKIISEWTPAGFVFNYILIPCLIPLKFLIWAMSLHAPCMWLLNWRVSKLLFKFLPTLLDSDWAVYTEVCIYEMSACLFSSTSLCAFLIVYTIRQMSRIKRQQVVSSNREKEREKGKDLESTISKLISNSIAPPTYSPGPVSAGIEAVPVWPLKLPTGSSFIPLRLERPAAFLRQFSSRARDKLFPAALRIPSKKKEDMVMDSDHSDSFTAEDDDDSLSSRGGKLGCSSPAGSCPVAFSRRRSGTPWIGNNSNSGSFTFPSEVSASSLDGGESQMRHMMSADLKSEFSSFQLFDVKKEVPVKFEVKEEPLDNEVIKDEPETMSQELKYSRASKDLFHD